MDKNYLGSLQTRNTQYQGYILNGQRNGFGMLIDSQLRCCLGYWNENKPISSVLLIFGRQLFYGRLNQNTKLQGICYFLEPSQYMMVGNFNEFGEAQKIAIKFQSQLSFHLIQLKMKLGQIEEIMNNFITIECRDQNEVFEEMGRQLGGQVHKKNIRRYIEEQFCKKNRQFTIKEEKGQLMGGFREHETLGVKFNKSESVKCVGYYDKLGDLLVGRQYLEKYNRTVVREGMLKEKQHTYQYDITQNKPSHCVKLFEEFFIKSLNFQNKYLNTDFFQIINQETFLILKNNLISNIKLRYGQQVLEGSHQALADSQNKLYQLEEVKRNIYQALNRKNIKHQNKHSPYQRINSRQSPTTKLPKYHYLEFNEKPNSSANTNQLSSNVLISEFTLQPLKFIRKGDKKQDTNQGIIQEAQIREYFQLLQLRKLQQREIAIQKQLEILNRIACTDRYAQKHYPNYLNQRNHISNRIQREQKYSNTPIEKQQPNYNPLHQLKSQKDSFQKVIKANNVFPLNQFNENVPNKSKKRQISKSPIGRGPRKFNYVN